MKSGRASGVYSPAWAVSAEGATQPLPLSICQGLQGVLVLLVVGVAEEADRTLGAGDTLDEDVVVLGGLDVVAQHLGLVTDDVGGHVVVRAGVGAREEEGDLLVGEARVDLVPVGRRGLRADEVDELVDGEAVDVEVGVDRDGEGVGGDLELGVLDTVLLAHRDLVLLDRTRGVGDVGVARAEDLEPATGAGLADGDLDVGVLLVEELLGRHAHRVDGGRAVDSDGAADAARRRRPCRSRRRRRRRRQG